MVCTSQLLFLVKATFLFLLVFLVTRLYSIKVYYSPHLTGNIINEEDIIRDTKKEHANFSVHTLKKYNGIDDDKIKT